MQDSNKDKNLNQKNISGNQNQKQPLQNPGQGQTGSQSNVGNKQFSNNTEKRPEQGTGKTGSGPQR